MAALCCCSLVLCTEALWLASRALLGRWMKRGGSNEIRFCANQDEKSVTRYTFEPRSVRVRGAKSYG